MPPSSWFTMHACPTFAGSTDVCAHPNQRGCQKNLLPAPGEDAGVVTYIQPHLILRGIIGLVALARQCQPQLLVPTRRFHEAVMLDVIFIRLRNKKLQLRELGAVAAAATLSLEGPVQAASATASNRRFSRSEPFAAASAVWMSSSRKSADSH